MSHSCKLIEPKERGHGNLLSIGQPIRSTGDHLDLIGGYMGKTHTQVRIGDQHFRTPNVLWKFGIIYCRWSLIRMARWKDHRWFKGNGVTVYLEVKLGITKHRDLLAGWLSYCWFCSSLFNPKIFVLRLIINLKFHNLGVQDTPTNRELYKKHLSGFLWHLWKSKN